jgi:nicotinate-nucleotide pyrophosphorylase (carboxylating)
MAAGSIRQAVDWAVKTYPNMPVEVEVENLDELQQAIDAGAHRILLDNMDLKTLTQAVKTTAGKVELEASGGVNEKTIQAIANTGVNFISVGDITKNINAVDLSMRFS